MDRSLFMAGGGGGTEEKMGGCRKGWVEKNRSCQRVGKVKIIVCENTKIPLVIFRKMY